MNSLLQDFRFGLRMLVKNPVFTLITVVTLGLGIGANTAIFSVVKAVLLSPLPYENPGQLVRLWADTKGQRTEQSHFAPAEITDFRDQLTTFEEVGLFDIGLSSNLTGEGQPERVDISEASPALFTALRVHPIIGRTFLPDETEIAQSKVAIISEALWKRRFGADRNMAGRTVQLDGEPFNVVGVLPASFKVPDNVDLWVPFSFTAADWKSDRAHHYVEAVGRLKPGVSLEGAKAELETITQRLTPQFSAERKNWGVTLVPMHEQVVEKFSLTLWILFGAVGFVLLIACVNVANLSLTRAASRQKEMGIRIALGARRARVVRQLLVESLLLACAGGVAGILLAVWTTRLLSVSLLTTLPRVDEVSVDGWVLLFTLIVSIVTGVAFGLAPALQASSPQLNETLKEGGRHSGAMIRSRLRGLLVISEIALSLVLLIGAGLLVNGFLRLQRVNAGFDPRNVLTMQTTLPRKQYQDTAAQNAFVQRALRQIEGLPGVESAAATINLPLLTTWGMGYSVVGRDNDPNQIADNANITPNYFRTMGIPVLQGRDFSEGDTSDGPSVIIINEALARKHFPNEKPIGQSINAGRKREIVGVVADVKSRALDLETKPQIYLPYAQKPTIASFVTFTIRTQSKPLSLVAAVQQEIGSLDKDLPVANVRTMEQVVSTSLEQRRLTMLVLTGFAVMALMLASIGIYGVVAYSVARRTHEIGIRMALGAQSGNVLRLVVGQGLRLVLAGIAVGLAVAFALTRLMTSLLFGVTPTDATTFISVSALLVLIALFACYVPARRATKVDPLVALRYE